MKNPELLLPVGTKEMLLAAIHNGADAVYIGVPHFNARGRSQDFTVDELKEMTELAHLYGVKVHYAFNVLIFEEELPIAYSLLKELIPLGPDAFIVQDLGLAKLIRSMAPGQELHASTQMTVTNSEAMDLVSDLNFKRFVLGRENSLEEIKSIRSKSTAELEVFIHGALCVAYSGQCLTSESLGGRSANRGQCAQSCRLPYEMVVDGKERGKTGRDYLFSPKDLCAGKDVLKLKEMGINSLKIEGRLKSPFYVASSAREYRALLNEETFDETALAMAYSRGFFNGWLGGVNHQKLVDGSYSSHRGLFLGEVIKSKKEGLTIASHVSLELNPGDGLLFVGEDREFGGPLYDVKKINEGYFIGMSKDFPWDKIRPKCRVYKNSSPPLEKKYLKNVTDREQMKKIPLFVKAQINAMESIALSVQAENGIEIFLKGHDVISPSKQRKSSANEIESELRKLGGTCYFLKEVNIDLKGDVFVPQQLVKQLRREMVELLNKQRTTRPMLLVDVNPLKEKEIKKINVSNEIKLNILLRDQEQVVDLVKNWPSFSLAQKNLIGSVILDFEFGRDWAKGLELLSSIGVKKGVATLRVLKPHEQHHLKNLMRLRPDLFLVRNLGALEFLKRSGVSAELKGDFSLNVTNSLSADYLLNKGLKTLCPSFDLNRWQMQKLIEGPSSNSFEVVLHHYMPEFHMEHCVFAAFLSQGSSFRDCGKPCEKHQVHVKDPYGVTHVLKADQECRNTLFKGIPQSAGAAFQDLKDLGVTEFRLEFLEEKGERFISKIKAYAQLLLDEITPEQLYKKLNVEEKMGVTEGQLSVVDSYKDRKK